MSVQYVQSNIRYCRILTSESPKNYFLYLCICMSLYNYRYTNMTYTNIHTYRASSSSR